MTITRKIINDNDDSEMICLVLQLENQGGKPWHQRAECRGTSNLFTVKSVCSTVGRHRNQGGRRSSSLDHEPSLRLSISVGHAVGPLQAASVHTEADKGSLTCDRNCRFRRNPEAGYRWHVWLMGALLGVFPTLGTAFVPPSLKLCSICHPEFKNNNSWAHLDSPHPLHLHTAQWGVMPSKPPDLYPSPLASEADKFTGFEGVVEREVEVENWGGHACPDAWFS